MRCGLLLPQSGPTASAPAIVEHARLAEKLGFDSVFVLDRLLCPTNPRTPYPATPDGKLPPAMRTVYEPMLTLAWVAGQTERVRLGTGVLVSAFRSPALLAREACTLDALSGGRFICGLGLGWSEDEYLTSGVGFDNKGARFDEYLAALKAAWTEEKNSFKGKYYEVPENLMNPRPVQSPLPLWIGGVSDAALRRAARIGTGWYGHGYLSNDELAAICAKLRDYSGGRPLDVALWSPFGFAEEPRMPLVGPLEHLQATLRSYAAMGVTDLLLAPGQGDIATALTRFAAEVKPALVG